jgi:hypothetical protein
MSKSQGRRAQIRGETLTDPGWLRTIHLDSYFHRWRPVPEQRQARRNYLTWSGMLFYPFVRSPARWRFVNIGSYIFAFMRNGQVAYVRGADRQSPHRGIAPDKSERGTPTWDLSNPCNPGNFSAVYTRYAGSAGRYVACRLGLADAQPGDRTGERTRKPQTSLQQACNMLTTCLQPRLYSGTAKVLHRYRSGAMRAFLPPEGGAPALFSGDTDLPECRLTHCQERAYQ